MHGGPVIFKINARGIVMVVWWFDGGDADGDGGTIYFYN